MKTIRILALVHDPLVPPDDTTGIDILEAARNFQEASRNLNGSNQAFFTDFDFIYDLLTKARTNAAGAVPGGHTRQKTEQRC